MYKIKNNLNKEIHLNSGITLIALVVTIIVLLILAGVTISLVLGKNGIIAKAQKAKSATDEASAKEFVDIAVESVITDKLSSGNTIESITAEDIQAEVQKTDNEARVKGNNPEFEVKYHVNGKEYTFSVNIETQEIERKVWNETAEGKITNGTIELNIGDVVNYDHITGATQTTYTSSSSANGYGDQVFNLSSYTGTWQVLGVENGELLLISSSIIQPDSGGYTDSSTGLKYYYLKGQAGYINGVEELNKISAMYGQGKGATGARSINVDDINKITGYDPECTGTGSAYNSGQIEEYGNEVTYTRETSSQVAYSGTNGVSGTENYNILNYYDEASKAFKALDVGESITLKSSYYNYYPNTLTTNSRGETKGIATNSKEYEVLFSNSNSEYYWIGSPCFYNGKGRVDFWMRNVNNSCVGGYYLYFSIGQNYGNAYGIRSLVSLKSDIQLEQDTTSGAWNIK